MRRDRVVTWACPVCAYPALDEDPALRLFNICPRCGTEFGHTDYGISHAELRRRWEAQGCPAFDVEGSRDA